MKKYIEFNGTSYAEGTDKAVISALESLRGIGSKTRIRLFYGYRETGEDWGWEYGTTGTIGRSMGTIKIPILLASNRSNGGGAILTDCILRIDTKAGTVYQHPKYHKPEYEIASISLRPELPYQVWRTDMDKNTLVAASETEKKARSWIAFMRGERWSK